MEKILIIEDDQDLQEGLAFSLKAEGYHTDYTETKREGMELIRKTTYDLILLDCNLPDGNGFDLCREVRRWSDVPMLMLTARDSEIDEVRALELGVDDYMSKPFSIAVLKARIKKLLGRGKKGQRIVSGGIMVDTDHWKVYKDGEEILFSKLEYKLLLYFLENKNRVLSKKQILERIWDSDGKFVDENTVSVHVRRIRMKIEEDPSQPQRLKTVHGIGYIWGE